jgi:hypothetical protein
MKIKDNIFSRKMRRKKMDIVGVKKPERNEEKINSR